MSRRETTTIHCDVCDVALAPTYSTMPIRFDSHSASNRTMRARGWYYDASTDRCPKHWPGHEEEE